MFCAQRQSSTWFGVDVCLSVMVGVVFCVQRQSSTWFGVDVCLSGVLPTIVAVSAVPATSSDVSAGE